MLIFEFRVILQCQFDILLSYHTPHILLVSPNTTYIINKPSKLTLMIIYKLIKCIFTRLHIIKYHNNFNPMISQIKIIFFVTKIVRNGISGLLVKCIM